MLVIVVAYGCVLNQNPWRYNHLGFLLEKQNFGLTLRQSEICMLSEHLDNSGAGGSWTLKKCELEKYLIILGNYVSLHATDTSKEVLILGRWGRKRARVEPKLFFKWFEANIRKWSATCVKYGTIYMYIVYIVSFVIF